MLVDAIEFVTFFALVFYIVFGGADYGAGILELFRKSISKNIDEEIENITTKAIGPVWEVNHIWLVLIIVILFNGFPQIYLTLTTHLFIPILAVMIGIVLRGVSLIFRHYDLFPDSPVYLYSWIFAFSSLWTTLWLGAIAGSMLGGKINPSAFTFKELYINPWFNFFSLALGIFGMSVFSYIASSFLIDETRHQLMKIYFHLRARKANLIVVVSGGMVFLTGQLNGLHFFERFISNKNSLTMLATATILWLSQELLSRRLGFFSRRVLVFAQVICILLGLFFIEAPHIIVMKTGALTMANSAAPESTLQQLTIALICGLVIILPSMFTFFWIFKLKGRKKESKRSRKKGRLLNSVRTSI